MPFNKERSMNITYKVMFLASAMCSWEVIARANIFGRNSRLLFPTLEDIAKAFVRNFQTGYAGMGMRAYVCNSLLLLGQGLLIGVLIAFVLSGLSIVSCAVHSIFDLCVSLCDLLPGVALLPVVIVVFGVKPCVIVFLVVHAVLWPVSRNLLDGFASVPAIYIEAGKNIGLRGAALVFEIYIPAAMPYILSGLKAGWARAWRGLISAEMIFGLANCPGIGLYINQMRTNIKSAEMYATLIVIIIIGAAVQYGLFGLLEKCTIKKWGVVK